MILVFAAIESVSETSPIGGMLWQTLLVMIVFAAVATAVISHVRYRRIMELARASLERGGTQDAFALAITDRIGFFGKNVEPFGILLIEREPEDEGGEEIHQLLLSQISNQLRTGDRLIHLEEDRIGLILETSRPRTWEIAKRIQRGIGKEHGRLASGEAVSLRVRIAVTSFPECSENSGDIVQALYGVLAQTTRDEPMVGALIGNEGLQVETLEELELEIDPDVVVAEGQSHLLDELTGVLKTSRVGPAIQKFIARYRREEKAVSIVVVDIDALEQYNDHYGRAAGDAILKHAATFLMRNCRESDLIGRLGGEEFVILMDCAPEHALAALQRMTHVIKRQTLQHGGNRLRYTVGGGVAGYPTHGGNPVRLFDRAVLALETAKKRGRSSCMIFDKSMEHEAARKAAPVDAL